MSNAEVDAVVVGSGPNGMAAAVTMARAGLSVQVYEAQSTIGGGARTLDLGLAPGITHDICSAVHPLAISSPFFVDFDLRARGLEFTTPEVSYAQPLDNQPAALAFHDLETTVDHLGAAGPEWRRFFAPLLERVDDAIWLSLGDKRSIPETLRDVPGIANVVKFGLRLLTQASPAWNIPLSHETSQSLFTGVAAHAIGGLPSMGTAATATMLSTIAHAGGWPSPVGGSQAIIDAMVADLEAHGGSVTTNARIDHVSDMPAARAYLLDTSALNAAQIFSGLIPAKVDRSLRSFKQGNAAAKVDFVLNGPVPWADPNINRAGTIHVGGTRAQMAAAEADVIAGRMPAHPVSLVSDPTVFDPSREVGGLRPLWTYAHVPFDCPLDPAQYIIDQIERFAPGFRDTIVTYNSIPASEMAGHNQNYIGGDIATGLVSFYRMMARPRTSWDNYGLGVPGAYLCSAATPPAPGVHGMNGWFAAQRALKTQFGITEAPSLAP
ncbi:MAG: phytoene desaturase family protein [Brevibacterium aurantiacum]|uniref:NAD(P)/FAD-dependent oxidoreductase n=1 Tax=Brevibacterium aurantiacum TaxID=273384 RepID=A0A2A3Z545_BREAU|nr:MULTISPECIES: NAD(P)/FAD-dependent oxidoreductase [Brevibacterium]AZL08348.1 NAD(P)/FAD-dependent oxidoreductase [Brevibacterium aurantiacum]AZL11950.1 NAD(P)/FAD-dependent oxidoreductase [Brevibacterium aurantiacum]AZT96181.1 NAD(P)/FAD-dependent oxidoreductase [Brevibacterium aurantiacum]MDN5659717.1 NAD(P)/FAD-dependent oxidoreductase [Brevibacterium aurantiacum]MDN5711698.1 NAD(P)/FAD-dependent oxidoreductase [Brevibacterium aurantiacum]